MQNPHLIRRSKTLYVWAQSLRRKHADLDKVIEEESAHPLPDALYIQRLKRGRLRLKDQLVKLEARIRAIGQSGAGHPA